MSEDSGLLWGIRTPFIDYVQRTGGTVSFGSPASWHDGRFRFARSPGFGSDPLRLKFEGEALFQGHGGFLRLSVANPWITRTGSGLAVSVDVDGDRVPLGVVVTPLAAIAARKPGASELALELAPEGVPLFGGVYSAGTELDPIVLCLPAGFRERLD